jgi:hypothetical protein
MTTTQNQLSQMTTTFQRNALDISYNGWENYETWNVALWINNEEGLYHLAMEAGDYETLVDVLYNELWSEGNSGRCEVSPILKLM